jgi:hypothetical protein
MQHNLEKLSFWFLTFTFTVCQTVWKRMYPPAFCYRFTNSHSNWSYECTPRRVSVFEEVVTLPCYSEASLAVTTPCWLQLCIVTELGKNYLVTAGSCVCHIIVGLFICLYTITLEVFICFLGENSTCNVFSYVSWEKTPHVMYFHKMETECSLCHTELPV